ncbi:alpha/beta hydrolase [Mesorhizobium sp. CAU 1741]|uniref:alpha/beta fold hydrolase n=1 Tax=Mesorhizobium sp. CAU 1741 TaxID=3140366 RepID=UPI00325ACA4B
MDRFADLDGLKIRYRVEGDGDWLVLVHGVGGSLHQWDRFVTLLGGRYRTLRFDQRGHGQSDKPRGPYHIDDLAGDLRKLLDTLGIESCHLAGASLGALVAQGFALADPQRLSSLVLLAGIAGRTEQEKKLVLDRLAIVQGGIPGQHFSNSVERWFTDDFRRLYPEIIEGYAARNQANDSAAYAAAYAVLAKTDFAERLREIQIPTLIVTGEEDKGSNPRMAAFMHSQIEGSQLVILPKLRHSLLIEAPGQVLDHVERFLDRY